MRDTEFLYKIFWLSTIIITTINSSKTIPKLFVLLIDGLRYDSVQNETLSGFSSLKNRGVSAHHLEPNFPSTGYPNYYTLLTGMDTNNVPVMNVLQEGVWRCILAGKVVNCN